MATKYNSEGRVPANYPGLFNARENRMITHNYCVVEGDSDENISVSSDDNVTHVIIKDGGATPVLTFPKAELSKGRLISVKVEGTAVDVKESDEATLISDDLGEGSYQFFCTGSEYIRVF